MICPYCSTDDDKVIDSRASDGGESIRRRRICNACGKRFTTYERVEKTARLMVVKRDGSRVPFDPESILRGVQAACGKRPIPEDAKREVLRAVEDEVHREFEREVASAEIGRRVASKLRGLDQVAYIRFASEYYGFGSLEDFLAEIDELAQRPGPPRNHPELFTSVPADAPTRDAGAARSDAEAARSGRA
ncbi:MAG TPA: transcriptional regulator NrdR [Phycisphaerales bacterium]|nr:transcriptional regulator NrdR [Phycisphaerales bacterium]HMP36792.1 transcriptional regulator NrdR [Phycisphaerales bacterium]